MAFLCATALQAEIVYKVIDLGTLGGHYSFASSINDAGQIVGDATHEPRLADHYPTLFDATGAGNNIALGDYGGSYCINNAGQIVGVAEHNYGPRHATLFDTTGAGNNIDLGTLGGDLSDAHSINDAGQIVGWAETSKYLPHATLFDRTGAGNNIDLGTLGGDWSEGLSINDSGQIVGWAQNSQGDHRATLFDPTGAGNNIDLGTLGGDSSEAVSINDAGQIVGYATNTQWDEYTQWQHRATLFDHTGAGNNIDLNTLIDPASGWTLRYANDINNSGWIVGSGRNPQGEYHAFLLVPKPPCLYRLAGDLSDDCRVDFADLAVMAANWLVDCAAVPTDPACVPK